MSVRERSSRLELTRGFTVRRPASPARGPHPPSPAYRSRTPSPPMPQPHPHIYRSAEVHPTESPTSTEGSLPNPNMSVENESQGQLDERSLNILAAREISKQMGSPLSSPSLPFAGRKSVSPRPSFTTDTLPSNSTNRFVQTPPPPPKSTQNRDVTPTFDPQQLPPPPTGVLSHSTSVDSTGSDPTQVDDPYRTPPEYLRNPSTPPSPSIDPAPPLQIQIPQVSPILPSASTPTTTKKISAAAFRRPGLKGPSNTTNAGGDSPRQDSLSVGFRPSPGRSPSREGGDSENVAGVLENIITPLNLRKKSLPLIPGPPTNLLSGPRDQGAPRSVSSPFPNPRTSEERRQGAGWMPPLSSSPEPRPRESMLGGEDEFDYVSAYLNEDERRESVIHNGATNWYEHSGGRRPETDS